MGYRILNKILLVLTIVFAIAGIGLLVWLGIGQYIAQMNYDGQYIQWRIIKDVSLWGYSGIAGLLLAAVCYIFYKATYLEM